MGTWGVVGLVLWLLGLTPIQGRIAEIHCGNTCVCGSSPAPGGPTLPPCEGNSTRMLDLVESHHGLTLTVDLSTCTLLAGTRVRIRFEAPEAFLIGSDQGATLILGLNCCDPTCARRTRRLTEGMGGVSIHLELAAPLRQLSNSAVLCVVGEGVVAFNPQGTLSIAVEPPHGGE